MNLAECVIDTRTAKDKFRIYVIGDLHSDSLAFDEPRFKAFIAHIAKDPQCVALCVGDYVEGRVPGQKHFDPAALIPEARQHIGDYVSWALDRSERLFAPLRKASTPLFLWAGNHDHYMQFSGFCAMLADRLKATYMADEGMIRVSAGRHSGGTLRRDVVMIYGTHGSGGAGLPGAKVNAMQRYMGWVDADVIVAGHVHDGMIRVVPRIGMTVKGRERLVQRPVALVRAPAFVRRAVQGVQTYASRKGYPTADDGLQYLESVPRKTEQSVDPCDWRDWQRHEFVM